MDSKRVIYVSAVSNEFHSVPPEQRQDFQSYRDVLKEAFRILAPHYEVVVQEDLIQGFGDLLKTLEYEIGRSLFVIHLVGELAGLVPESSATRRLHEREPNLLSVVCPAIGHDEGITYTQWELYLALHLGKPMLIFEAQPEAPRSPLFAPTAADAVSQEAHSRRIQATGQHRGKFHDQGDVARKCMRSFLHFRLDPLVDPLEPSPDNLAEAWAHREEIVKRLASAIKNPDPRVVPVTDPANTAAFVVAVRAVAEQWSVNLSTVVDIAARHEEQVRAAIGDRPTSEALYDEAFASLALGDYTVARFYARRAADVALRLLEQEPENGEVHREVAGNALLLLHDAAKAARDISGAIAALQEAGSLIDKEADPLRWADVHEALAAFLLEQAHWNQAAELISDIIDIREEYQGENHRAVAGTLLLWSRLLDIRANYQGVEAVAARAEHIFAGQTLLDVAGLTSALSYRAGALFKQNRFEEAERLMRQALAFDEQTYGPEHPKVGLSLNNLAFLLQETNRLEEAESLARRTLEIYEQSYGLEHAQVTTALNNLALLLMRTNRLVEAEPLLRRALAIDEQRLGITHPELVQVLNNLAYLLMYTDRQTEAEPLMRQALTIDEQSYGSTHPHVARGLSNLGAMLTDMNRPEEAEPLLRRALEIGEQFHDPEDPKVATFLHNLALLLQKTNRLEEAEPLMRRAVKILRQFTVNTGYEHPELQSAILKYAALLHQMGRNWEEILAELNTVGVFANEGGE